MVGYALARARLGGGGGEVLPAVAVELLTGRFEAGACWVAKPMAKEHGGRHAG